MLAAEPRQTLRKAFVVRVSACEQLNYELRVRLSRLTEKIVGMKNWSCVVDWELNSDTTESLLESPLNKIKAHECEHLVVCFWSHERTQEDNYHLIMVFNTFYIKYHALVITYFGQKHIFLSHVQLTWAKIGQGRCVHLVQALETAQCQKSYRGLMNAYTSS